jgi:hypothetical protein
MKSISRLQIVMILWLLSPLLFGAIETGLLNPNNIWPNNDGAGLPLISSILGVPYLIAFYILYFPLSWLPLEGGGTGAFVQILPNLNTFGVVLMGGLLVVFWGVIGFWLGKKFSYYAWQKYVAMLLSFILLFDISLFGYQVYSDVNGERSGRMERDSVFERCNASGPEYDKCMTQCGNQLDSQRFQDSDEHNKFWLKCTAQCDALRMDFQTTCLRESGLPEYETR